MGKGVAFTDVFSVIATHNIAVADLLHLTVSVAQVQL